MAKTLITGATGFIGSAVARALHESGRDIRVLLRSEKYIDNLEGIKYEIAKGDLTDIESLRNAMVGCDRVFHVAALYLMWTLHPELMHKTNVDGTRNVLTAAMEAGVERVVYTSSIAAYLVSAKPHIHQKFQADRPQTHPARRKQIFFR